MDNFLAEKLAEKLCEKEFRGYMIKSLIDFGKSAAVFKAEKELRQYAVKIFDNDLIERFGHKIQTTRIEQEIQLKNHKINGMVEIIDGGKHKLDGQDYYFIIMEFIEGENLKKFIEKNQIDEDFILRVLGSLFSVAERLLELNIVHRDIKPENIMVRSNNDIILMDFGVLKLIGTKSFTDNEEKQFIGTLRYASPEYLNREEEDNSNGWKAINLYQIGGVLHDLICKKVLFENENPYAKLVAAINNKIPEITSDRINYRIIQLTRNLLSKNPKKRIDLCNNKEIESILKKEAVESSASIDLLDRLKRNADNNNAKYDEITSLRRTYEEKLKVRESFGYEIKNCIQMPFKKLHERGLIDSYEIIADLKFESDRKYAKYNVHNYLFEMRGEEKQGFLRNIYILIRVVNDDNCESSIMMQGVLPSPLIKLNDMRRENLYAQIDKERNNRRPTNRTGYNRSLRSGSSFKLNFKMIFDGVLKIDNSFEELISSNVYELFLKLLEKWKPEISRNIERMKQIYEDGQSVSTYMSSTSATIILSKW